MLTVPGLRRRLNAELALSLLPQPAWLFASIFAVTRLIARSAVPWVSAVVGLLCLAWWGWALRRRAWTDAQVAIRLDRLASAGGLLLTLREVPDDRWTTRLNERLEQARPPSLQLKKPLALTSGAVLFVLVALLMPLPQPRIAPAQAAAEHQVDTLVAKELALAQEQPIPPPLAAEIEKLREEASAGRFDAADWEASDSARDALEAAGQQRADALQGAAEAAAQLEEAIDKGADAEEQARQEEALESALASLSGNDTKGTQGQKNAGDPSKDEQSSNGAKGQGKQGKGKRSSRSKAELQALQKALKQRQQQLGRQFPRNASGGGSQQYAGLDSDPWGSDSHSGHSRQKLRTGYGPSHGPAPETPLSFGDETKFQKNRLRYAPLQQGLGQKDSGELWGLSRSSPTVNTKARTAGPSGVASGDETAPGVQSGAAPPRYRDLVQRYFTNTPPPSNH